MRHLFFHANIDPSMALVLQYFAKNVASDYFILILRSPETNLPWTLPKLPIIKTTLFLFFILNTHTHTHTHTQTQIHTFH